MAKKRVVVIGAGPAGMTAAYQLSKDSRFSVHVYEAGPSVGGMAKSIRLWNQWVDLGPHRFFSTDPRVNRIWLEAAGRDYVMVDRLTRIFYRGKFFFYPLRALNALLTLGIFESVRAVFSYLRYRVAPLKDDSNFENWVTNRFGKRLYSIFFKTYSEKLWGIPCTELDADFAVQRIKKFSLMEAIKNALIGGGQKHKTLVDQFAFPRFGTGKVYENMASRFQDRGGKLELNSPVKMILLSDMSVKGVELEDGSSVDCDHVISSMPLTLLVSRLEQLPEPVRQASERLRFRNTILVYLKIEVERLFDDQWLYIHSDGLEVGRITNFRNWSKELYGSEKSTILAMEYWCDTRDSVWKRTDQDWVDLATREIVATKLCNKESVKDGFVARLPRSYPIYETGYREQLTIIESYLRKINGLSLVGRYGAFKYNNQDHSILMGYLASENLINAAGHDLWSVNTDDEYQERTVITATGLAEG